MIIIYGTKNMVIICMFNLLILLASVIRTYFKQIETRNINQSLRAKLNYLQIIY